MKIISVTLWALLIFAVAFISASWQSPWVEATMQYVPSSTTNLFTSTTLVGRVHLANKSGGAVTVTLKDRSTNCGGAACEFWPAVSIAANTVYSYDLGSVRAVSGVQWSASAANAVVGSIQGRQ